MKPDRFMRLSWWTRYLIGHWRMWKYARTPEALTRYNARTDHLFARWHANTNTHRWF